MTDFVWTFQGGKKTVSVTSVTLVSTVAKTIDITVPGRKRWLLIGIKMTNPDSVVRNVVVYHYKEAVKTNFISVLLSIANLAAAAATQAWSPNSTISTEINWAWFNGKILESGETLSCVWQAGAASAGGTDADGLVIEYLEMDA